MDQILIERYDGLSRTDQETVARLITALSAKDEKVANLKGLLAACAAPVAASILCCPHCNETQSDVRGYEQHIKDEHCTVKYDRIALWNMWPRLDRRDKEIQRDLRILAGEKRSVVEAELRMSGYTTLTED